MGKTCEFNEFIDRDKNMKRVPTKMFTSFKDLVQELDKFFKEEWTKLLVKEELLHTTEKDKILLANIRLDLEECSHAFFMLYRILLKLRDDQRLLLTNTNRISFQQKMRRTQALIRDATILIKSLYSYFFAIREMIFSSENIKSILSERTNLELERICEFRSKLIVHKQNQKLFTGSSRRYNTEDLNITLQIGQYASVSKAVHGQCKKLYEGSQICFPEEDQGKENYYSMADALYKNLHLVPNHLKGDVKGFISAYGVSSDPPLSLGLLLKNLLKEYYEAEMNIMSKELASLN